MSDYFVVEDLLESIAQLEARLEAAQRLYLDRYMDWSDAGGPVECKHGVAIGIDCRRCDKALVFPPTNPPADTSQEGKQT